MPQNNPQKQAIIELCKSIQTLMKSFNSEHSPWEGIRFMTKLAWSYKNLIGRHLQNIYSQPSQQATVKKFIRDLRAIVICCIQEKFPQPSFEDQRFKSTLWHQSRYYYFHAATYLALERCFEQLLNQSTLVNRDQQQLNFCTQLILQTLNPHNTLHSNPQAIKALRDTRGVSLIKGITHLFDDFYHWQGHLGLSKVNPSAFIKGKSIACSPGKVIMKNRLVELIFYEPKVNSSKHPPLLWVTSWVNKFYIIDLRPENSLVQYALSQGFPVFTLSWVNPSAEHKDDGIESYLHEALVPALKQIHHLFPNQCVHAAGYCLGGTLLLIAAAYFKKTQQNWFKTLTLIASIADFHSDNAMACLMGSPQRVVFQDFLAKNHVWDGYKMQVGFNLTHSHEYVWPFVQRRYLQGKKHLSIDSIYWALDLANTTEALYWFYINDLHGNNCLMTKNKLLIGEVGIDLSKVDTPCCLISFNEDTLAPPKVIEGLSKQLTTSCTHVKAPGSHIGGLLKAPRTQEDHCDDQKQYSASRSLKQNESWWPFWVGYLGEYQLKTSNKIQAIYDHQRPIAQAPGTYIEP